ncbi:MAG: hypothetical protein P4L85_17155 [Paludisphaera borealis]|uniref:hypothetical protein n=1 Tax=Paludisphaera borealis TaxID=1387353 RepID=UPI0028511D34|nr:hypothetical protein [Paludisphaera borealis]MDR3621083.1 hypothetical protein [Paludisphaera borealis]
MAGTHREGWAGADGYRPARIPMIVQPRSITEGIGPGYKAAPGDGESLYLPLLS